ncbi:MAG: DUF3501 family protein [Acidimicrobiales bacterium]
MTEAQEPSRRLVLGDIEDLRGYERHRDEFLAEVMAIKARRRLSVGPVVTLVFENRETMLFQVQEMARAERIMTDEGIQAELDIYNPLIPEPGTLSATLFIELTSPDEMKHWLPRLVGIERSVDLVIAGQGDDQIRVRCQPEAAHASQLTREEVTASVHYVTWQLTPGQVAAFREGQVTLATVHPEYDHTVALKPETKDELVLDLGP